MRTTSETEPIRGTAPRLRGRYLLQRQIGSTRHQRRFLGFDTRLRRWCTVHVPKARVLDHVSAVEGFMRQAEELAALSHPHLLQVLDLDADGPVPFVVTELAMGGSLSRWMRSHGPMEPTQACEVVLQVAHGLGAMHTSGRVHGRLQPGRVLLHSDGRVVVTDLGWSVSNDDPAYVAPEVRHSPRRTHGPGADIYSLGALLFSLVSGQTSEELFYAEAYEGLLASLPTPLQAVVLKACAVEPRDRYRDIAAFEAGLSARASRLTAAEYPPLVEAMEPLPSDPPAVVELDRGLRELTVLLGAPAGSTARLENEPFTTFPDERSEDSLPSMPYRMPNPDRIDPGFRDPFEDLSELDVPEYVAPEGKAAWRAQVAPGRRNVVLQGDGSIEAPPELVDNPASRRSVPRWLLSGAVLGAAAFLGLMLLSGAVLGRIWLVERSVDSAAQVLHAELQLGHSVMQDIADAGGDERGLGEAWGRVEDAVTARSRAAAAVELVELASSESERLELNVSELPRWQEAAAGWRSALDARARVREGALGRLPGWDPEP